MKRCCTICDELRLVGRSPLAEALGDCRIHNAVLCGSRNYTIIPSIGPLAIGHVLLVTRDHKKSIMHSTPAGQLREIGKLLHTMFESDFVWRTGGETLLCFEHGTTETRDVDLCSTSHAHLHVLPLKTTLAAEVWRALGQQYLDEQPTLDGVCSHASRLCEYIACFEFSARSTVGKGLVVDASGRPSQYMRRLIMRCLGEENWDWKVDPRANILRETVNLGFKLNVPSNGRGGAVDLAAPLEMCHCS